MATWRVFKFDANVEPFNVVVAEVEATRGVDALLAFAAAAEIEVGDGPASGKHWISGRSRLDSFGAGQYHVKKVG